MRILLDNLDVRDDHLFSRSHGGIIPYSRIRRMEMVHMRLIRLQCKEPPQRSPRVRSRPRDPTVEIECPSVADRNALFLLLYRRLAVHLETSQGRQASLIKTGIFYQWPQCKAIHLSTRLPRWLCIGQDEIELVPSRTVQVYVGRRHPQLASKNSDEHDKCLFTLVISSNGGGRDNVQGKEMVYHLRAIDGPTRDNWLESFHAFMITAALS